MDVYISYEVLHAFVQLLTAKAPPLHIGEAAMPGDQADFFQHWPWSWARLDCEGITGTI